MTTCTACKQSLDPKGICWHCSKRACSVCGREVASPFIELCHLCERTIRLLGEVNEAPVPGRNQQVLLLLEVLPSAVPAEQRLRTALKRLKRNYQLRCRLIEG